MPSQLTESYARCEAIARNSGSSFYRSFSLLSRDRRQAMTALYAFARLADDATDDDFAHPLESNPHVSSSSDGRWNASDWHCWLDSLPNSSAEDVANAIPPSHASTHCLAPIRLALADAVCKFAIPIDSLHDLVRGVDTDRPQRSASNEPSVGHPAAHPAIRMQNWEQLRTYCHRVASSVGIACLSIWAKNRGEEPDPDTLRAALDCGVAFQMTNILRDLAEDRLRNRIYLPHDELARFHIDSSRWVSQRSFPTVFSLNELGDWRGLVRLQIERAIALYTSGWRVAHSLSLDGQRMFSLMWHSYRTLLSTIEQDPELIWNTRIRLSKATKVRLIAQHLITPWYQRVFNNQEPTKSTESNSNRPLPRADWPQDGPRVAVIGAGLAGINAALHLARHGCRVTLLESKNRIGGRVGSFTDAATGQAIDYCQHVGMNCCTALKQFLSDTDQAPFWIEQDTLRFASELGKRIDISAWPLPAPLHLAGLLVRWPKLTLSDRFRISLALLKLIRLKRSNIPPSLLAIDWLQGNGQSRSCIENFWSTILVSALGEQVDRVNLEATHKVLVDGFASDRSAYHLLVPNRPISQLLDECVATKLRHWGVDLRLGNGVKQLRVDESTNSSIQVLANAASIDWSFDAVVAALPWNKIAGILEEPLKHRVGSANTLTSSPITGIHTWWDRPWMVEPHSILINRLSQWIFPAPEPINIESDNRTSTSTREFYYQVVISASRQLPSGDTDAVLRMIKQDLAEVFPESAIATLLRGRVVTDPNAVFSVTVGHDSGRLKCNALADKRIWLAGDWTATQWPATMEGALRSGLQAAEAVLDHYGRAAQLSGPV